MACSSTCETRDHASFGECLRAKHLNIGYARSAIGLDLTRQKRWDSRLQEYRDARRQGIQPRTSRLKDIRHAIKVSNETGVAFDGTK